MGYTIWTECEVDVNIDDVLDEMSSSDKRGLCEQLIEEGYGPRALADQNPRVETYTDSELQNLMNQMWANRDFFDTNLIDELKKMLRDRNII
jgi:hypothetical protein